jgi:hypothetical protein
MDIRDWLLASDPAIRWQALRDLTDADPSEIAAERARVAREGIGAAILARQAADGAWHLADEPDWIPSLFTPHLLRATGADPDDPAVAAAMARLATGFHWHESLGGAAFFEGETEPCINGNTLAIGGYFRHPSPRLAARLLDEQLGDGGWNCEAPRSQRASYHSTICVLEGLLEYERATAPTPRLTAARARGVEYLLARHLFRRLSTGEIAVPAFAALAFPPRCYYDVLRGLDHLRDAGVPASDPRIADAIALLRGQRQPDGRWLLAASETDSLAVAFDETVGAPSRWITLRALRVLRWYED